MRVNLIRYSATTVLLGVTVFGSGCGRTSSRVAALPPRPAAGTMDAHALSRSPAAERGATQAIAVLREIGASSADVEHDSRTERQPQETTLTGSLAGLGRTLAAPEAADSDPEVLPAQFLSDADGSGAKAESPRFVLPPELPGSDVPQLRAPPYDPDQPLDERREMISQLYEALPALPEDRVVPAGSSERPWNLAGLQQTAYENSPLIRAAWADVVAAQGGAIQAGLYPNPEFGYQGDTINTGDTAGYNGVFFSQRIVTAGKLDLAQQSALMRMRAAEADYRRVRIGVASDVRRSYFEVLVARERARLARAMSGLFEEVYEAQIELVAGGEAAPYEPLQLRVLALQARNDVVTSQNDYEAAWRKLAAVLNLSGLAVSDLAGSVEASVPEISFDTARSAVLSRHSDLAGASAEISAAVYNRELQCVRPIPDINVESSVFHDDTSSLNDVAYSVQIGVPLPLFDRNQGNITAADAELMRAQSRRVAIQNRLTGELAEAYAEYQSSRELASTYREDMLPSQVQTYRGVYERFREAGGLVDFAQVVVAQQTLGQTVEDYLTVLSQQWESTVALAELLQADDLYTLDGLAGPAEQEPAPIAPVPAADP